MDIAIYIFMMGNTGDIPKITIFVLFLPCLFSRLKGVSAQYRNIAYSNNNGQTFTQYKSNPILDIHSKEFWELKSKRFTKRKY